MRTRMLSSETLISHTIDLLDNKLCVLCRKLSNCGERRRQSKEFRRKLREAGLAYPVNPNSTRHRLSKKELKRLEREANKNENEQQDEDDLQEVETTGEVVTIVDP